MKFAVHANRYGQIHLNYNTLFYGTCPEQAAEDAAHKRHVTSHRVTAPDEYLHNDSLTCLQRHQDCDFARMESLPESMVAQDAAVKARSSGMSLNQERYSLHHGVFHKGLSMRSRGSVSPSLALADKRMKEEVIYFGLQTPSRSRIL